MIESQGRTRAKNHAVWVPITADNGSQLVGMCRLHLIHENHEFEASGADPPKETVDATFGNKEFLNNLRSAIIPAKVDDMFFGADWSQPHFEFPDTFVETLGENGYQNAHEKNIAGHSDERGYRSEERTFIVAEIAWIRQPQEGPPDRIKRIGECLVCAQRNPIAD